ncbi:MAG: phenylalanyl-tRNA synthetase beta chain [Actinomycetota bacterium]|nr:phenylalanyl-tRNA synthetase beta chain [Actinomycetota bacterium]
MKVGLKWLQEFVAIDVPVEKLVDLLDLSGTKVESVSRPGAEIQGVIVAEVLDISEHPNADNLTLVEVKISDGETQRVVCGARNFSVGDRVPLARVGSRLPGMEITERKIRGEVSQGMLCSASELGVSRDHSGILVLAQDAPLGDDVVKSLGLDDTILEFEITPNRPDCMGVLGLAREISVLLDHELRQPDTNVEATKDLQNPVRVEIEDPVKCPRFLARYIEGVKVGPTPGWMTARLLAAGVRSISNVVDVTNYVMLELGQPLHAYDAAQIRDNHIIVRRAKAGEKFVTLDGTERTMHPEDLMIADRKRALGIAGVMGGAESEVSETTTTVILECANFDPASIAYTSRRHILRTEASARFERGMDPDAPPAVAARAARLITELAGGGVSATDADSYPTRYVPPHITLRPRNVTRLLGAPVPANLQISYLRGLGLRVSDEDPEALQIEVPGYRPDLKREVDLIEEVGRLAGFDRLPATLPPGRAGALTPAQRFERGLRMALAIRGGVESWTSSFGSVADLESLGLEAGHPAYRQVQLSNPTNEEQSRMRTTLLPGLLRAAAVNASHRKVDFALFEIGRVYEPSDELLPTEALVLGAIFGGVRRAKTWDAPADPWDVFSVKGTLEAVLSATGAPSPQYGPASGMPFHPTRAAWLSVGETRLGAMGEVHPDVCERFDVPAGAIAVEIALAPLLVSIGERAKIQELPRFPSLFLDLAVVVDEGVLSSSITDAIRAAGAPELVGVRVFDVYQGEQVPAGKKSLAYALELRRPDRTMTEEEALEVQSRILVALQALGAELRS